jgi:hypothetical protein
MIKAIWLLNEILLLIKLVSHSPALASHRGIGEYPPLSASFGSVSSSPKGEAVIMKDALWAMTSSGAFWRY